MLQRAANCLTGSQSPTGVWPGVVRSTVRPTAEYVLLLTIVNHIRASEHDDQKQRTHDAIESTRNQIRSAAAYIASQQMPEGHWSSTIRGRDLDTSLLAYLALRVAGHAAQAEHIERARTSILDAGGIDDADPLTLYWFAVLGVTSYQQCLPLSPEFGLFPSVVPGSVARRHLLGRSILVAVSLLTSSQPIWSPFPGKLVLPEVSATPNTLRSKRPSHHRWANKMLGWWPKHANPPTRRYASRQAEAWLSGQVDRENGGIAGDATATIWATVALLARGRRESDSAIQSCLGFLDSLQLTTDALTEIGLAKANVRSTAIACRALGVTGVSMADVAIRRCVDWLLTNESFQSAVELPPSEMSGWSAQGGKVHRVDTETTALVLLALREQFTATTPKVRQDEDSMVAIVRASSPAFARRQIALLDRMAAASRRSRRWLMDIQNPDGGWGRFDRSPRWTTRRPSRWSRDLPDSDVSSPVISSWVLEALCRWEALRGVAVQKAIAYLRSAQRPEGCWSEHGVLSIFATWRAVSGLIAAGVSPQDPAVASAVAWLMSQQLKSGGWCDTAFPSETQIVEPVSIVQTAWALLTLVGTGFGSSVVARRAVQFLQHQQQTDGGWAHDGLATGYRASIECGREPYAAVAYPVLALAAWARVADCQR